MTDRVEKQSEVALPGDLHSDAHSEIGDGSSSLSDIEDKDAEQEELDDLDELDSQNQSETDANESEAETERLENSPHKHHKQKDVVLSSQAESRTFERSPSKLNNQFGVDAEDEDDNDLDELSDDDDEASLAESPKSLEDDRPEQDATTAATSLGDSSVEGKGLAELVDMISKKRKRSQLLDHDSIGANDLEEPARKRTGSVGVPEDEYAIDDTASVNENPETSNPISGDISDAESADEDADEDQQNGQDEDGLDEDDAPDTAELSETSSSKLEAIQGKKRKNMTNGVDVVPNLPGSGDGSQVDSNHVEEGGDIDDTAAVEADDADTVAKYEEEQEMKRFAMDQLSDIERHFSSFRDRLHQERIAQLDLEEQQLKEDPPTHPGYLAMLKCIDARRDERLRIDRNLTRAKIETAQRSAVGKRSQILSQYFQEVREIRERNLEILGKHWYEIQHDRRGYGDNVKDYGLQFPTDEKEQLKHQAAYNKEVSLLSGIAKHVGFPAAPAMAAATPEEMEEDFKNISKLQMQNRPLRLHQGLPISALRAATSSSAFKPAEEQFIEQTPWANPQHPSHAHMIQRQSSAHAAARTGSPFSIPGRRHSHQHPLGGPVSGTFSGTYGGAQPNANGAFTSAGRISPLYPFANAQTQRMGPSPLASRQTSISPQQNRVPPAAVHQELTRNKSLGAETSVFPNGTSILQKQLHDPAQSSLTVKHEQPLTTNGEY